MSERPIFTDTLFHPVSTQAQSVGKVIARGRAVIDAEIEALEQLKQGLNGQFYEAVRVLEACHGRIVVTGMGKSGIIGRKIAATLSSTGSPALFLHPAEGSHGDLGTVTKDDVVVAISNSGETPELLGVLPLFKRLSLPIIAITNKSESTLARQSTTILPLRVTQEACPLGLAPTSSTTNTLVLGDALALTLIERKGFTEDDFAMFHPGGSLGKKLLLRVADLMHHSKDIPKVTTEATFLQALMEITSKKLGLTLVVDPYEQVVGIITDGDVRRALTKTSQTNEIHITEMMTQNPKSISADSLAAAALTEMENHRITAMVVLSETGDAVGVIHLHDIIKTGIR